MQIRRTDIGIVFVRMFGIVGAVCYALKRPKLWQRVFSYHEVFHLLVIAASATFMAFIVIYVI